MPIKLHRLVAAAFALAAALCGTSSLALAQSPKKGRLLSDMTWVEAKAALTPDTVVVIPLGAEAKEHGPHLPLDTDYRQAIATRDRVMAEADVIVAPPLNYGFYPAFVEYPGSTHLTEHVSRDMMVDIVRGLARFGPRRFYVINIGLSTNRPLSQARALLAVEGIALWYSDFTAPELLDIEKSVTTQAEGTHADEIETSVMLAIDPKRVDMTKAAVDYGAGRGRGPFTPDPKGARPSPTGIYGDATRATVEKGVKVFEEQLKVMLRQIEALRAAAPPARVPSP